MTCRVFVLTGTERLKSKVTCHTGRYWYCLFINRWETGLMSRFDNFSQWKRHLHFHSRQKISIPQTEKKFSVCFSKIFPTDRNLIINFNFFNWLLLLYYLPHLKIFWITHKYLLTFTCERIKKIWNFCISTRLKADWPVHRTKRSAQ